jgi:hypothetical protein
MTTETETKKSKVDVVPDEFREKVVVYLDCDDEIKKLNEKLKELKLKKKDSEDYILTNFDKFKTNAIEIKGNRLNKVSKEVKKSCKPDAIKETLNEEINDSKKVNQICEKLESKRNMETKCSLKRTQIKQKEKGKKGKESKDTS